MARNDYLQKAYRAYKKDQAKTKKAVKKQKKKTEKPKVSHQVCLLR